jgi:hypothetical protein
MNVTHNLYDNSMQEKAYELIRQAASLGLPEANDLFKFRLTFTGLYTILKRHLYN